MPGFPRRAAALALLLATAACHPPVVGNGVFHEERREVGAFEGVRVESGISVYLTVQPGASQAVTVSSDQNIVEHLQAEVAPELVGTTTVSVLHLSVSIGAGFQATIPPRAVITVPRLVSVAASESSPVSLDPAAGSTVTGPVLSVVLDHASLDAATYPVEGAEVRLTAGASALLHAEGPVTGTASLSILDNRAGTGSCAAVVSDGATITCR